MYSLLRTCTCDNHTRILKQSIITWSPECVKQFQSSRTRIRPWIHLNVLASSGHISSVRSSVKGRSLFSYIFQTSIDYRDLIGNKRPTIPPSHRVPEPFQTIRNKIHADNSRGRGEVRKRLSNALYKDERLSEGESLRGTDLAHANRVPSIANSKQ